MSLHQASLLHRVMVALVLAVAMALAPVFADAQTEDEPDVGSSSQHDEASHGGETCSDEVVIRLPADEIDPTNTQVGPDITGCELDREGHYHTAEAEFGAPVDGVEVTEEEIRQNLAEDLAATEALSEREEAGARPSSVGEARSSVDPPIYINLHVQAHPDDEAGMWSYIDYYADNSQIHQVFAVMTRGEQTQYCTNPANDVAGEIVPIPVPDARWEADCDNGRIATYRDFIEDAANIYDYLPMSYYYQGEVKLTETTPVNPCVRDNTADGINSIALGVDGQLDAARSEPEFSCTDYNYADRVRIYQGNGGVGNATILFFNLGDGDLSVNEVKWAMDRIIDSKSDLQLPNLPVRYVLSPFATPLNTTFANCTRYAQPDHVAVREAVQSHDISQVEQRGATCSTDPAADRLDDVPTGVWNYIFGPSHPNSADSLHDKYYGWLFPQLWSRPYSSGTCTSGTIAGYQNCLHSQRQNHWSSF